MTAAPDESRVEIVRALPHHREDVFATLLDGEAVSEWMCPDPNVAIEELRWRPEVGASYEIVMRVGEHRVTFAGTFQEIAPPTRLVFTWTGERTAGHETLVTIELAEGTDGTDLRLVHEALPTPEIMRDHEGGWTQILERLAEFLDAREPGSGQ